MNIYNYFCDKIYINWAIEHLFWQYDLISSKESSITPWF